MLLQVLEKPYDEQPKAIFSCVLQQCSLFAKCQHDPGVCVLLSQVLERPYDEQPEADAKYSSKPPPEMVRPGVCVLSCSS